MKRRHTKTIFSLHVIFLFFLTSIVPALVTTISDKGNDFDGEMGIDGRLQKGVESAKDYQYYTYDEMTLLLHKLHHDYPHIMRFESIGTTHWNRSIWCVKISDNVDRDEDEPEVLYMGGVHGNEKPGYEVVIYSIKSILENYSSINDNASFTEQIRSVVNNTELYFIPMVNPDGVIQDNRKNMKPNNCPFGDTLFCGVDINRNFGYKWDEFDARPFYYAFTALPVLLRRANIRHPCLDFYSIFKDGVYRGPYNFSEQESTAIKDFIKSHHIFLSVDYHSCGQKILYPWTWTDDPPADENVFLSIAKNISNENNYSIRQGGKWYPILGCSKDWFYGVHGIFSFSIELCEQGMQSPTNTMIIKDVCKTHVKVNLVLAKQAMDLSP